MPKPLGRRRPSNLEHVSRFPLMTLLADPTHELAIPPVGVEKSLGLPHWWKLHNQGQEGACVGFGCSAMVAITNHVQRLRETGKNLTYRYDSRWLYLEAQPIDEWSDTPPGEGTSVEAACKILHARGHRRVQRGKAGPEDTAHGIAAYRWARNHDEVRAAIFAGLAVAIGVSWHANFDRPEKFGGEWWIGRGDLGHVRGGHCVALYRMSDRRKAFRMMNSWGPGYPPVWLPYAVLDRLIDDWGEVVVVTDK